MEEGKCKFCGTPLEDQGVDGTGLCITCISTGRSVKSKIQYKRKRPKWVNNLSIGLGIMRLACYLFFFQPLTTDAQWQLDLIPLNIADFPITMLYWWLPAPIGEAFIGPVWWFFMPRFVWWFFYEMGRANPPTQQQKGNCQPDAQTMTGR